MLIVIDPKINLIYKIYLYHNIMYRIVPKQMRLFFHRKNRNIFFLITYKDLIM